ncbi:integrase, catalytic region, zinc finger, CCHC-type containing protein, partial [Tanacetum coccineum]
MTDKDSSAAGSKPMTPFVHTRPANNEVHKKVWKIKEYLTAFEPIIQNGRAQPCWSEYRRSFVNEIIPFYENIKNLSQNLDTDIYTEVKEFERSLDKMESDYDKCLADNKRLGDKNKHLLAKTRRLQRVMTDLWNDNERFIADNIAKYICSFVLSSEKQVSPRSNCSCKELQSNYDKGHSRVVALEAEVLEKQQMLAKSEHQSSLIQKQFPPTNNQLRSSSNSRTHATVHDGQIVTETVQRRAPGNVGNTGSRGNQSYGNVTTATGKKVICYNCRGEGHVARQCKEPKRKMDSQYFKDKALLMEAKEKGDVLDAEAEAFLADVECTAPYDQPQALTTTR